MSNDEDKNMNIQDIMNQEKAKSKIHQLDERTINVIIANKAKGSDEEFKKTMNSVYNSDEYKTKKSNTSKSMWARPGFKEAQIEAIRNGWTEEKRLARSKKMSGIKKPPETIAKMRKPKEKRECPHCGTKVAPNMFFRHHNDNCKLKK
jgi:hypothetical protein